MERMEEGAKDGPENEDGHSGGAYHVNTAQGRVAPHGEELTGAEILARAGFNHQKYELWTISDAGTTGLEILPDQTHHVKPGDHYRATIRRTDYSHPGGSR